MNLTSEWLYQNPVLRLEQTQAPAAEPVTLTEAKNHLWVSSGDDDTQIDNLITAARQRCERVTGLQLVTATWKMYLDRLPWGYCDEVIVPRPPLQSISSIAYVDTAGATQTLSSSIYQVDAVTRPGRIRPAYGQIWPSTRVQMNAITITFVAGFGAASAVPQEIKDQILACVKYSYDNRDARDEDFMDRLFVIHKHGWEF